MQALARVIDRLNAGVAKLTFWAMLAVVLIGAFNAIARYLGKGLGRDLSSNSFIELQWYLFGVIFLLSGAYTLQREGHVRVDVLYDRLGKKTKGWIDLVGHTILLLPFAVFAVIVSLGPVADSWKRLEQSPDPGGLPRYPIKLIVPLAFGLLALQGLSQWIKQVAALREPDAADDTAAQDDTAVQGDEEPAS